MAVTDLFSKRLRRTRGEEPEVFSYDDIPDPLRVQIIYILNEGLGSRGDYGRDKVRAAYQYVVETLRREYGVFKLSRKRSDVWPYLEELHDFIMTELQAEKVLDAVEMCFRLIDRLARRPNYIHGARSNQVASTTIEELNVRFREHGLGYQYENGEIIRVDSQLVHSEVVKPALLLLNQEQYAGAQQEFLSAYEHYRHDRSKEALNDALKALESTMKAICDKRKWPYDQGASSKKLIEIMYEHELVPPFWHGHMGAIRSLLEGGVPTARNKLGGHGQGAVPIVVPPHIVGYVLHMTAAAIVFLAKAEEELP